MALLRQAINAVSCDTMNNKRGRSVTSGDMPERMDAAGERLEEELMKLPLSVLVVIL